MEFDITTTTSEGVREQDAKNLNLIIAEYIKQKLQKAMIGDKLEIKITIKIR